uniref:Uncharacterized protein n=1 Tax=Strix occidentalis caurina TaxID=311401 RepID=A0A8D0FEN0_STROC
MPVGNNDSAPKHTVFTVTPTVQGGTEVNEAVPSLTLSKYSHSTAHCSPPLLGSSDLANSASQVAGTAGVHLTSEPRGQLILHKPNLT